MTGTLRHTVNHLFLSLSVWPSLDIEEEWGLACSQADQRRSRETMKREGSRWTLRRSSRSFADPCAFRVQCPLFSLFLFDSCSPCRAMKRKAEEKPCHCWKEITKPDKFLLGAIEVETKRVERLSIFEEIRETDWRRLWTTVFVVFREECSEISPPLNTHTHTHPCWQSKFSIELPFIHSQSPSLLRIKPIRLLTLLDIFPVCLGTDVLTIWW